MEALKRYILGLSFVKESLREGNIEAFRLAQKDILETLRDDLDKKSEELAQQKLAKLLSPIDPATIVTFDTRSRIVYIGGEKAEESRLGNLKSEADFLAESDLWKILVETPKKLAEKAMFLEGENLDTMKKGRSMLYTLATQQKILDTFRTYAQSK